MRRVLISTFGLAVCLATAAAAAERAAPAPWLEPCKLEGVEGRVWCGTYRVFENRAAASGRQIEINVVIAAALGDAPRPDPIFFFAGGPGLGAAQGTLPMSHALAPLREQRDLVFIDQRGTGASHPLACPLAEDAPLQQFFESLYEPRRARECRLQLGGQADLAQYANPVAMDDIEEVREALGYSRINLLGVSYGGRSALVYLRQHGEHVRAAVLKGPAPPNEEPVIVVSFARKTDRALRAAFDACRSQPECHAAYPRLEEEWQNVIAMVETGQVSATVADPRSGEAVEVYIRPLFFKDGVRRILYDLASEPARRLPELIHAASLGDFSPFASTVLAQTMGLRQIIAWGAYLAITCAEDIPFIGESEVAPWTDGTFFGADRLRRQMAACAAWGSRADLGAAFRSSTHSDVPVLVLSGVYDTASSPEAGEAAMRMAGSGSLHVIFPNESHGVVDPECEIGLMAEFIEREGAEGLDLRCVAQVRRPAFLVGPNGAVGPSGS